MVKTLRYRGPDAQGIKSAAGLGTLGHARLSIIDTGSVANQPMTSQDEKVHIAFNGEIFNYLELRDLLQREHGCQFDTNSDTEVLLHAYLVWGEDCVTKLNGMWAFIVFDERQAKVFVSRDRFGIKPLYYARSENSLVVASEAKAIIAVAPEFRVPNYRSLSLVLRASVGGQNLESCFLGIQRLPPAHNLVLKHGEMKITRYWEYPCEKGQITKDCDEEFASILSSSVDLWTRSDVPIGFSISGGLDSTSLLYLFRELKGIGVNTYTACYSHPDYREDESTIASSVCQNLGIPNTKVNVGHEEIPEILRSLVWHIETPHAAEPMVAYWNIMKRARNEVKVMIEGQGADELLAGYVNTIAASSMTDDFYSLKFVNSFHTILHGLRGEYGNSPLSFALMVARSVFPFLHQTFRTLRGDENVYIGALREQNIDQYVVTSTLEFSDRVNRTLHQQHSNGLVNLLQYSDAISMAHSIEARVPFLDHRLVEMCFRMPGSWKFHGGLSKVPLRKAMFGTPIDRIARTRPKRGFDIPMGQWLRELRDSFVRPVLLSRSCRERGIFDPIQVEKLLNLHFEKKINISSQIFRWIMTELWFQRFIDTSPEL